MESSRQEHMCFRDIVVVYQNIEIHHKVNKLQIVGEYFRNIFQQDLNHIFNEKAKQLQIQHYVELKHLKKYDVRLNSRDDGSVMNVTFDFSTYSPQKRLKFYVINLTDSSLSQQQKQYLQMDIIEVVLLSTPQKQKLYKIKVLHNLTMQQLKRKISADFQLDKLSQLIFFDLYNNKQLMIDNTQKIEMFLAKNKLTRFGVRQVHSAG